MVTSHIILAQLVPDNLQTLMLVISNIYSVLLSFATNYSIISTVGVTNDSPTPPSHLKGLTCYRISKTIHSSSRLLVDKFQMSDLQYYSCVSDR